MRFSLSNLIFNDIGIDLGTANTLIYVKGKGIVVDEPSVAALETSTRKLVAIGSEAKEMEGRTPERIEAIRPLKDGVVADFEVTELLLRAFIRKVQKNRFLVRPKIVICVPSGITEVEKRAVRDSAERVGAREVYLITEPISAAIGMGLPVEQAVGSMVIDIGGGTTEIAVMALSGIVMNSSIKIAGDEMDEDIIQYLRKNYNVYIGPRTAENIKCLIGSAYPTNDEIEATVKGRDLVGGIPKIITVHSEEMREALSDTTNNIVNAVLQALERTPPELASDILDRGINMVGGGSLLKGLADRLIEETKLPVMVAEDPLTCVVRGTGKVLENINAYQDILF